MRMVRKQRPAMDCQKLQFWGSLAPRRNSMHFAPNNIAEDALSLVTVCATFAFA